MTRYAAEPPEAEPPRAGSAGLRDARTLRPGSSILVGVAAGLAGLALLVPAVMTSQRSWGIIASVVLAMVLLWLFVVRPSATIHAEGIRLVNPLRNVDLTWPAIDEVRSKWALELLCEGRKYTAWGVPADAGRPKHGRGMLALASNKVAPKTEAPEPPNRFKVEAQAVAAEIEARREEDSKRKDGRTPRVAIRAWDRLSVGLLLGALAFFAIAVLFT